LVELQLAHSAEIKGLIDHAWGVGHGKHKKKEPADIPIPDPSDPYSRESLSYGPVGQDSSRKRYWVVDGPCTPSFLPAPIFACICPDPDVLCAFLSLPVVAAFAVPYLITNCRCRVYPVDLIYSDSPRVYLSTNPWKVTSTIQTVSSTRDQYVALIDKLKASASKKPKLKTEIAHQNLISILEGRIEVIDKELAVRFLAYNNDSRLQVVAFHFRTAFFIFLTFLFYLPFVRLTRVSSEYNERARRSNNGICFLLRRKLGKRVRGGKPAGLIMLTTAPKIVTYVSLIPA
jgi:hypothetical protein